MARIQAFHSKKEPSAKQLHYNFIMEIFQILTKRDSIMNTCVCNTQFQNHLISCRHSSAFKYPHLSLHFVVSLKTDPIKPMLCNCLMSLESSSNL